MTVYAYEDQPIRGSAAAGIKAGEVQLIRGAAVAGSRRPATHTNARARTHAPSGLRRGAARSIPATSGAACISAALPGGRWPLSLGGGEATASCTSNART